MGKYVIYTNATTAWLLSDDLYGKLTSGLIQAVTVGGHLSGTKLIRGYVELGKKEKEKEKDKDKDSNELKITSLAAKTGDKSNDQQLADRAEAKEMEEDYIAGKEDPNRCVL
jgi:hypothetical protein